MDTVPRPANDGDNAILKDMGVYGMIKRSLDRVKSHHEIQKEVEKARLLLANRPRNKRQSQQQTQSRSGAIAAKRHVLAGFIILQLGGVLLQLSLAALSSVA